MSFTSYSRVFLVLLLPFVSQVRAQCCSPGNPVGGRTNLGVLPSGEGKLLLNYSYGYSGDYVRGSRKVEPTFVDAGYFHHLNLSASYGISGRLTVESELTYFLSKVQEYVDGSVPASRMGYGVGDWSGLLHLNVLRDRGNRWEVSTGLGLKVPIGSYRRESRGALLPLDVQPTSGGVDFLQTLFLYRGYPEKGVRFFALNRVEKKTANPDGYRYGDLYATSLFASANLGLRWNPILQIRSEIRRKDVRRSGAVPVTGSTKLFLSPQVSYTATRSLVVTALAELPIYQYYNGAQLATSFSFGVGLVKKLGGAGLGEGEPPPLFTK